MPPHRLARLTINALLACSACAMALLLMGKNQWALHLNMILTGIGAFVFFIASLFIDDKKRTLIHQPKLLNKKLVISYYVSILILLMFSALPQLGATASYEFSINGLPLYALLSGLMITILLQLRARQLSVSNQQFAKELLLSTQQTELEKVRREEQSQLLTMLMHEIKNPLAVIDLAQQGTTDLNAQDYLARNVTIIKNILDRCLSIDRLALGKLDVQRHPVVIDAFLQDLKAHYGKEAHRIQMINQSSTYSVHTDDQCLQSIMNNLIDNALRYGHPAQAVTVAVYDQTNASGVQGVALSVTNSVGLAGWPDPTKVFQKYYRSNGAKSISGTGLGLFLVASLVNMLGGICRYVPDDTQVRFELWLPT
jgi:signal transduction histidine kinase